MDKFITSIGNFYNSEDAQLIDVPADESEIHAKILEIMDRCPSSTELSDDDFAVLRAYLPAIGCAEATQDDNGSLQGKEVVKGTAEGCGIEVEKTGTVEVVSRWHAERKQWSADMAVTRKGGTLKAKELTFDFYFLSIGVSSNNKPIILFNEHYTRTFNDPRHLEDFNNGGTAQGSRFDISKHNQWGYYVRCTCSILTDEGTLLV